MAFLLNPVICFVGSECASYSTPLCLCCTKSIMDESDNFNHFTNLYLTTFTIAYYCVLLFQRFFSGLLGPYTLYTFQKINFFELQYFIYANSFFLPCEIFQWIFELLTTKTLLVKLNCHFFSQSGKYNIYLLFISFLLNEIIKGTSKEPRQLFLYYNYRDKLDFFPLHKSSWNKLIHVFGLISPSTGLKKNLFYGKCQDLLY